jgi:hypothetical protein
VTYHVDLSRILEYVSPDELERFENEQFRIETEAEAVAMRIEAEEVARRRLEKNARVSTGQGSRLLNGLGLDGGFRTRGRPRGRGRGRGRGSWRGQGVLTMNPVENLREELVDAEVDDALHGEEEMQLVIAETDSEDGLEAEAQARTSPTIARSAFVANSALPISPVQVHRRPSGVPLMQREPTETSDDKDSDIELVDPDVRSMSSAGMQLRFEDDDRGRSIANSEEEDSRHDRHRNKRPRTESTSSSQRKALRGQTISEPKRTNIQARLPPRISNGSDEPQSPPWSVHVGSVSEPIETVRSPRSENLNTEYDNTTVKSPALDHDGGHERDSESVDEDDEEDAEEYVVEAIIEHYRDAGKKYYLVKWQGYEDSHDWLPEEDLEGAAELVAEYNEKVRRRKLKGRQKMKQ